MYLLSPYDCLAHVGQALIGTQTTYDQYSWTWSLASLFAMNAIFLNDVIKSILNGGDS